MFSRYQGHESVFYVFIAMSMSPKQLFLPIFIYQSGKRLVGGQSKGASTHQGRERYIKQRYSYELRARVTTADVWMDGWIRGWMDGWVCACMDKRMMCVLYQNMMKEYIRKKK